MTPTVADYRRLALLLRLIRAGRGVGPTVREIGEAWGFRSTSMIVGFLDRLEAFGLIRRLPNRARAIEVAAHLVPVMTPEGAVMLPVADPDPSARRADGFADPAGRRAGRSVLSAPRELSTGGRHA